MVKTKKQDGSEEKILSAAKKVFLEKGLAGARMQDIADEAGINKALLHYYFKNKEKLFSVIFKAASTLFFSKLTAIIESDQPITKKIENFCSAYIDMLLQNPYLPLFVLNEAAKQPQRFKQKFWKNREQIFLKFAVQIAEQSQKKNNTAVNPGHLFMNMISMCIFPFIAKPIWLISTGMNEDEFRAFAEERKKIIPQLIIDSIKK
ncbi:MAG TPA: TetR/AcrR family transcriptional regulator [Puia sp.]|nr:TetR/AcrR family transcriptional regulator [Puia sp.]